MCQVVCVCCGYGFPNGMAQTSRIHMIGRALVAGGCKFSVLNIGGGLCPNPASKGVVNGIRYAHLPGPTKRYANANARKLAHALGALQTMARLFALRRQEPSLCVYSWFAGGRQAWFNRYLRLIQCSIVQDACEWWPGAKARELEVLNLRLTQGSLAISLPIIERLKSLPSYTPAHRILHVPILVDPDQWAPREHVTCARQIPAPYILWCGDLNGYTEDVEFLMRVAKAVNKSVACRLVLVGVYSAARHKQLCSLSASIGPGAEWLRLPGYVPDDELRGLMNGASALLLPLWETERSLCRFPTKLGQYLSSTTPVVATALGDLTRYLEDGYSACLVAPNAVEDFATRVIFLLRNQEAARRIGAAGRQVAKEHFSVAANQDALTRFFQDISATHVTGSF